MSSPPFRLRAGDIVTRADLVVEYGGSVQSGGIVPSKTSNSVFVFTAPPKVLSSATSMTGSHATGRCSTTRVPGATGIRSSAGATRPS